MIKETSVKFYLNWQSNPFEINRQDHSYKILVTRLQKRTSPSYKAENMSSKAENMSSQVCLTDLLVFFFLAQKTLPEMIYEVLKARAYRQSTFCS